MVLNYFIRLFQISRSSIFVDVFFRTIFKQEIWRSASAEGSKMDNGLTFLEQSM